MKTYDPKQVIVTVGDKQITGFAEDSMVEVDRLEDAWALTVGVDGEGTRAKSNNKAGTITLRLAASSDSNAVLGGFAIADEVSNAGLVPVLIKDKSGQDIVVASQAYVKKMPTREFARENTTNEWVMETDNLVMSLGGN